MNSTYDPRALPPFRAPREMTVVVDGEEQSRIVCHYDTIGRRYVPELRDGEEIVWVVADYRPHIVRVSLPADPDFRECPVCGCPSFISKCNRCGYDSI